MPALPPPATPSKSEPSGPALAPSNTTNGALETAIDQLKCVKRYINGYETWYNAWASQKTDRPQSYPLMDHKIRDGEGGVATITFDANKVGDPAEREAFVATLLAQYGSAASEHFEIFKRAISLVNAEIERLKQ